MNKKAKVYCKHCKHYSKDKVSSNKLVDRCWAEENVTIEKEEDWYECTRNRKFKRSPSVINKNNNCKWYEYEYKPSYPNVLQQQETDR